MIVVIGSTDLRGDGLDAVADGLAGRIATAAAADGAAVELITKVGDEPIGDALMLALARAGVGHVAVLRDAAHATTRRPASDESPADIDADADPPDGGETAGLALESADVDLALQYLADYRVVIAVHPTTAIASEAAAASAWAGAHLILVNLPGAEVTPDLAPTALVLEVSAELGVDSAIGARLGSYAAAVDRGDAPDRAYVTLTTVDR